MTDFNPKSTDAMFARILVELESVRTTLKEVRDEAQKTNGRVTRLDRERWYQRGIVAAVSILVIAAWNWWTGK